MDAPCCLYLSQAFGMTLATSWVTSKILVLKRARMVGRETRPSSLPRPSLRSFRGPQFSCQLVNMQQLRRGRGHPASSRPRPRPPTRSMASAALPRTPPRTPPSPRRLPLLPGAVNSPGFQTRVDSKMAALRDYVIMNAPRSFPPPSSLPFRHTSRFVLPKLC